MYDNINRVGFRVPHADLPPRRRLEDDDYYPRGEFIGMGTIAQLTANAPAAPDAPTGGAGWESEVMRRLEALEASIGQRLAEVAAQVIANHERTAERLDGIERDVNDCRRLEATADTRLHVAINDLRERLQLEIRGAHDHVDRLDRDLEQRIGEINARIPAAELASDGPGDCSSGRSRHLASYVINDAGQAEEIEQAGHNHGRHPGTYNLTCPQCLANRNAMRELNAVRPDVAAQAPTFLHNHGPFIGPRGYIRDCDGCRRELEQLEGLRKERDELEEQITAARRRQHEISEELERA